jgi:hypothetical protein
MKRRHAELEEDVSSISKCQRTDDYKFLLDDWFLQSSFADWTGHESGCVCAQHTNKVLALASFQDIYHPSCWLEYRTDDEKFCIDDKTHVIDGEQVMFPGRRNYGKHFFCKQKSAWQFIIELFMSNVHGVADIIVAYAPWTGPLYLGWLSHRDTRYGAHRPIQLSTFTGLRSTEDAVFVDLVHDHNLCYTPRCKDRKCDCRWTILTLNVPASVDVEQRGAACSPAFQPVAE